MLGRWGRRWERTYSRVLDASKSRPSKRLRVLPRDLELTNPMFLSSSSPPPPLASNLVGKTDSTLGAGIIGLATYRRIRCRDSCEMTKENRRNYYAVAPGDDTNRDGFRILGRASQASLGHGLARQASQKDMTGEGLVGDKLCPQASPRRGGAMRAIERVTGRQVDTAQATGRSPRSRPTYGELAYTALLPKGGRERGTPTNFVQAVSSNVLLDYARALTLPMCAPREARSHIKSLLRFSHGR